jgi:DNA replication protein DnaC
MDIAEGKLFDAVKAQKEKTSQWYEPECADLMDWCKKNVWRTGIEEGMSEEQIQKKWDRTLWEIENEPAPDLGGAFAKKIRKEHQGDLDNRKQHLTKCLPLDCRYITLDDWQTPTKEHAEKKNLARKLIGDHLIQFWLGNTSRGKTMLAAGVAKKLVLDNNWVQYIPSASQYMSLFARESTQDQSYEWKGINDHINATKRFSTLIIDEFNYTQLNQYQQQGFFDLINIRRNNGLKTLFISNNDMSGLKQAFSAYFDRIDSRVNKHGAYLDFNKVPEWKTHVQVSVQDAVKASIPKRV